MSNSGPLEDLETFREPQRGFAHVEVPTPTPTPWPRAELSWETRISGAGREMGLGEFLDVTSSTSCLVVVDGVLVHEWYADGVSASDRLLGNSATKSALSLLDGDRRHPGSPRRGLRRARATSPSWTAAATGT